MLFAGYLKAELVELSRDLIDVQSFMWCIKRASLNEQASRKPQWKRQGTSSLERQVDKIVYELYELSNSTYFLYEGYELYELGQRDIVLIDNSVPSRMPLN